MEDNRKIAEWAGYKVNKQRNTAFIQERYDYYITSKDRDIDGNYWVNPLPFYTTSDSDAITLLPVLVARGYWFELVGEKEEFRYALGKYQIKLGNYKSQIGNVTIRLSAPTISAAITSAVLALIAKEAV